MHRALRHTSLSVVAAQTKVVRGSVTDADSGEPLLGVNIVIKGDPANGVTTDIDGNYAISVNPKDILVFSYIGMLPQEIVVGSKNIINVALAPDAKLLGEVVVTALGIKRSEKSLPYATQKIQGEELTKVPTSNLLGNLAGKTAGMMVSNSGSGVGSSVRVVLRGNRSIQGNNQPLYVVDGTPINSSNLASGKLNSDGYGGGIDAGDGLAGINPEDIESLNVLKGASAAALYGAQAANGVVMITTKRGASDRTSININSSFQADLPYMTYKFQDRYAMGTEGKSQQSNLQWGAKEESKNLNNDFIEDFFNTGNLWINSVSVSGGSKMVQNYFSYQNTTGSGIMPKNSFEKHNLALRSTTSLFDKFLDIDASVALMSQKISHAPSAPGRYFNPLVGLYLFPEGTDEFNKFKNRYEVMDPDHNVNKMNWNHEEDINKNPYWLLNRHNHSFKANKAITKLNLTFYLTDYLNLKLRGSYDYTRADAERKVYYGASVIVTNGGRYERSNDEVRETYADALLNFNKNFDDLSVLATVGTSLTDRKLDRIGNRISLKIINLFSMNNFAGRPMLSEYAEHRQLQSVFGTVSLGWKDMLYLDATARNDWSSTLPDGNRSYFYPSIGGSFIFTEMLNRSSKRPEWLSFGKVRASWTQVGNDMPWGKTIVYNKLNPSGDVEKNIEAPFTDLKPEKSTAFETGLSLYLFDNRLNFDAAYYVTNTKNQYFLVDAPSGTGFSKYYINAGEIRNNGFEATLGLDAIRSKDFNWHTSLNFTTNRNKVISLPEQYKETGLKLSSFGFTFLLKEGEKWGEMYKLGSKRDEQGRIIVTEKDGKQQLQDAKEETRIGNVNPNFLLGWSNEINYRNFTVNFQFDGRFGGKVISGTQGMLNRYGRSAESADARDAGGVRVPAVTPDGKAYDKLIDAQVWYASKEGEFALYKATNIRLRELSIGYNLPKSLWANSKYIKGARISLIGRNLFYIYRDAPFDPEATSINTAENGWSNVDDFSIPMSRNIGFSLNINF